jgi:hypothetical protein
MVCVLAATWGVPVRGFGASPAEGPYQAIVSRNVFGLNPAPTNTTEPEAPPPPLKITLTGITTMLGNKRALLSAQSANKQPETYILSEGQREAAIEVLEINETAGTVKVRNHGVEQILDFKTDGAKPQPVAAATAGVVPGKPAVTVPPPPSSPGMAPTTPPATRPLPTRSMRVPSNPPPTPPGAVPPPPPR